MTALPAGKKRRSVTVSRTGGWGVEMGAELVIESGSMTRTWANAEQAEKATKRASRKMDPPLPSPLLHPMEERGNQGS